MFIYENALTKATCENCDKATTQVVCASLNSEHQTADLVFVCLTCHQSDRIEGTLLGYSTNIRPNLVIDRVSDTNWLIKNT